MRLRADSTAKKPAGCDQAVSARRPLARRLDTTARPARVRIRNRKPCTRARRRLFGWKVRLPLATAFSSLCLASPSGRHAFQLRWSAGRSGCFALLAGAVPGQFIRIAAVSPTFGRLFEGTDEASPGQTPRAATRPHRTHLVAKVWPATTTHPVPGQRVLTDVPATYRLSGRRKERHRNATELLAAGRKTVNFGHAVSTGAVVDNEARMADRLAV